MKLVLILGLMFTSLTLFLACTKSSQAQVSSDTAHSTSVDAPIANQTQVHSTPISPSNYGFYPRTSANIPAAVRTAAASVYKIVTPVAPLVTVRSIFGNDTIDAIISKVEKTPLQEGLNQGDKDIYLFQLRACAKVSNPLDCKMFQQDAQSSAYVVGNGTRLRTAYHAVSSEIQALNPSLNSPGGVPMSLPIQILVYNSAGKLIFSGSANAKFDSSNMNFGDDGDTAPPYEDVVEVEFNKSMGRPLTAAKGVSVGDMVYTIGYPAKTSGRAAKNAPDATGDELTVSIGHALSLEAIAAKLGLGNVSNLDPLTRHLLQESTDTDADGTVGLSGGAMVNANGEVIGTYTDGNPADGSASDNRVSYGTNDAAADIVPKF